MPSNQPLIMTPNTCAMTEMIDPVACNDKCKMYISKFNHDKSEYNALNVAFLYHSKPAYLPNNDP